MRILSDLLETNLLRCPEGVALIHGDRRVTYRELAAEVARVAGALATTLDGKDGHVGILLDNSPEFLFAYLGAAAAGMVAVPINTHLQGNEVARMLDHAGCRILFTTEGFVTQLPELAGVQVVTTENWGGFVAGQPDHFVPRRPVRPDDVVVLLSTSGSTGVPKLAMLTHANLLSNVATEAELYGLTGADVFAGVLPMFHNYAMVDTCLLPLWLGATVAIGPGQHTTGLLDLIERHRVSFLAAMPAAITELAVGEIPRRADTSSLRMVQTGGAPLAPEAARRFEERFGLPVLEGYGCTEASSTVTVMPATGPRPAGSVGKVMFNQEVQVVDDDGRPLPVGREGEIVVRGPNVFAGYLGRPEETARAVRDGWLFTGDLGLLDADGFLYLTGRKKDVINVGGLKVWPAEVEAVLLELPGIRAACVVPAPDRILGQVVRAFIEGNTRLTDAQVKEHCASRLAGYKVPRQVECCTLPRTGSGKIAVALLRAG